MRRLLPILLLTVAVILGSAGLSWSADFEKGVTAYKSGDYATTLREWKPLAEQGHAVAQYNLGQMYQLRQGVSEDYKISVKFWHQLATERGNAHAMHHLGWLYQQGKGVPKNNKIAEKWWTLAAKQGLNNALFYKGILYVLGSGEIHERFFARLFHNISVSRGIGIYDNAAYWYLLAAEQGHADAQFNLGVMYQYGKGVPQDDKTAVKWYSLAAEQGSAVAQFNLGEMYRQGLGVSQNDKTAVKWFRLAAEQGYPAAQNYLGWMYALGAGIPKDYVYTLMWVNIAASNGWKDGGKLRDLFAKRMTPTQLETAQRLARECVRMKYKGC